jgi:hypothetical protein
VPLSTLGTRNITDVPFEDRALVIVTTPVSSLVKTTKGGLRFRFVPIRVTDPLAVTLVDMLVKVGLDAEEI